MRLAWGRAAAAVLAFLILVALSGCTAQSDLSQAENRVSKTILVNLPTGLGERAKVFAWEAPLGSFSLITSSQERLAKVTLSAPQEFAEALEQAELSWTVEDEELRPVITLPGVDLVESEIRVDLEVSAANSDLPAQVRVRLGAGDAVLRGYQGRLDLVVEEGTCWLEEARLAAGSSIRTGGWIRADLVSLEPGRYRLQAGFGFIEVNLPLDSGAKVEAQTGMGEIINELDFSYLEPVFEDTVGKRLTGWLNAGGSELEIQCESGDIYLYPRANY
ncbi:MAG: hypothetical protein H0Z38_08475 [Firmicutes bacterium]|nr:hypothetical protein [Bacillota bacterium]